MPSRLRSDCCDCDKILIKLEEAKTRETSSGITCTPCATITATSGSFSSLCIQPNCTNPEEQNKMNYIITETDYLT